MQKCEGLEQVENVTSLHAGPGQRITLVDGKPRVIRSRSTILYDGGPMTVSLCTAAIKNTALELTEITVDGFCSKAGEGCPYKPDVKALTAR